MSDYIFLKGKVAWCRPGHINQWNKWSTVLYPDAESLEVIRDLQGQGLKNVLSKDEVEGAWKINLGRPTTTRIRGREVSLTPPLVFDGSKPLPGGGFAPLPPTVGIGNGSQAICKMEVYSHRIPGPVANTQGKKAKAMRWESILITDLVPFERKDFQPSELQRSEGLEEAMKPLF